MWKEKTAPIDRNIPILTLLLVIGSIVIYALPDIGSVMVYDRRAIISGEVWRLFTGHGVHFSPSHLLYNLLAMVPPGFIAWQRGYRDYWLLCGISALAISLAVIVFQPEMQIYGGLSGIACGAIIFVCLKGLRESGPWRWICLGMIVLTSGKIAVELFREYPLFAASATNHFVCVPLSHVVGAFTAAAIVFFGPTSHACSIVMRTRLPFLSKST